MVVASITSAPQIPVTPAQQMRHIDALRPHPEEPREEIREDDEKILTLAASIIRHGVIEPLVISSDGLLYAGHRRRVASRVAFRQTGDKRFLMVPVVVNDTPPEEALELMLQENMLRESLTPLEEARSMASIKVRRSLTTVAALARHLHLPPSDVSQRLSILVLPPEVQALYQANELPLSVAPLLARVCTPAKQVSYAGLLARRQLNVTQFRQVVEKDLAPLALNLNMPAEEVLRRYTEDGATLRHKNDPLFGEACIFLDLDERRCKIYKARPSVCRAWPRPQDAAPGAEGRCSFYDLYTHVRREQGHASMPLIQIVTLRDSQHPATLPKATEGESDKV